MFRTLTRKVTFTLFAASLLMAIAATIVVVNIVSLQSAVTYVSTQTLNRVNLNGYFHIKINRATAEAETYIRTRDPQKRKEAWDAIEAASRAMQQLAVHDNQFGAMGDDLRSQQEQLEQKLSTLFNTVVRNTSDLFNAVDVEDELALERASDAHDELELRVKDIEDASNALLSSEVRLATDQVNRATQRAVYSALAALLLFVVMVLLLTRGLYTHIVSPIRTLSTMVSAVAQGDLDKRVAITNGDEVGDLQQAFNYMVGQLREQRGALEARNVELERSLQHQQQLFETVQQLSAPLLPLNDGIVVLPIVGHVDTQRADAITHRLLHGVAQRRARIAILDVTGIAALDTHVLRLLLQTAAATRLLGADVLLAGITSAMAQVIVGQNVDLGGLQTYRDLESAVEAAMKELSGRRSTVHSAIA